MMYGRGRRYPVGRLPERPLDPPDDPPECGTCDGTGKLLCEDCPHAAEKDADGLCQVREDGDCPPCPERGGVTAADRAEAAAEAKAEARAEARWEGAHDRERDFDNW